MIDFDRMLGKILGGSGATPGRSAMGGAAIGGILMTLLTTRGGRRVGGAAVKYGGLAALGALAYQAVQQASRKSHDAWSADAELSPPPALTTAAQATRQSRASTLVRAMIAAVHADGEMDTSETKRLFDAFQKIELDAEEKGHLVGLMSKPPRLEEIVREAKANDCTAEAYGASLFAIDLDHPAEHEYLKRLAAALGLTPEVVASIHREAGAPEPMA